MPALLLFLVRHDRAQNLIEQYCPGDQGRVLSANGQRQEIGIAAEKRLELLCSDCYAVTGATFTAQQRDYRSCHRIIQP
jgi:hypothetical protein